MKRTFTILTLLLISVTGFSATVTAQASRAQFINGSADPTLPSVDIYIDNVIFISDLTFKEATAYLEIPTDVDFDIDVVPAGGDLASQNLYHFDGLASPNTLFTIFLRGVVDTTAFAGNPDPAAPRSTKMQFRINPIARDTPPGNPQFQWYNFYNGITDSLPFNITASEDSTLLTPAGTLHYSAFTGYNSADKEQFVFNRTSPANGEVFESYSFDFSSTPNSTASIFATGFVDPANNQNGEGVQFHYALADGTVVTAAVVTSDSQEIPEFKASERIAFFPNPAVNFVSLDSDNLSSVVSVELFDTLGRRVLSQELNSQSRIDIGELPNGLYQAILIEREGTAKTGSFLVSR